MEIRASALRIVRVACGFRLIDAALWAGMRESQLSRVERGEASLDERQLARLAQLYGAPRGLLIGRDRLRVRGLPIRVE